jgi:hypothetical protein
MFFRKRKKEKDENGFENLMIRLGDKLFGNFSYDISPEGNVLFLYSDYIDQGPEMCVNMTNTVLGSEKDWDTFDSMNFDMVVFKGDVQTFKLTNEQMRGVFVRRNG